MKRPQFIKTPQFRQERQGLLEQYCEANGLYIAGSSVFNKKNYIIYRVVSIGWIVITALFALWSLEHGQKWFVTGILLFLAGYGVVFFYIHFKLGISRDKLEDQLLEMKKPGGRR